MINREVAEGDFRTAQDKCQLGVTESSRWGGIRDPLRASFSFAAKMDRLGDEVRRESTLSVMFLQMTFSSAS